MKRVLNSQNDGFTLVELLIVVAIIGIIAAIAIPNLLSAIQRGKQKKTMGDMKTVASTIEQYNTDNNTYPFSAFGASGNLAGLYNAATGMDTSYLATPIYKDGWYTSTAVGSVLQYGVSAAAAPAGDYTLCSFGKDGAVDAAGKFVCAITAITDLQAGSVSKDTTAFVCDIVIVDGQFMRSPLGKQSNPTACP